jgi:hypothetical protein
MPTKTTNKPAVKKVVKKVVKKTPAKKATKSVAKKVAKKAPQKKSLIYADDQQSFWVTNGQVLNSLVALRDALNEMEEGVYSYHAGQAHNDFANWVSEVLADNACAVELQKAKTPKSAKTVVVKHLKLYSV